MLQDIVEINPPQHNLSDRLEEALTDRNLIFKASSLFELGFKSHLEIADAIDRAMTVCDGAGIPVSDHFKMIYLSDHDHHTVLKDWRLSKLAYTLMMLNGHCDNPAVARLQIHVIKKFLEGSPDALSFT
jgi:hypothetical protein